MTQKICQAVWAFASKKHDGRSVNLSRVSEQVGVRVATLWTYHHCKARWTADLWVRTLLLLGHAKVEDGKLTIPLPPNFAVGLAPYELAYKNKRGAKVSKRKNKKAAAEPKPAE